MAASIEGTFWQYGAVFLMSATPWIELLIVIPVAAVVGLQPVPVAIVVFAGNTLPVFVIVFGLDLWREWRGRKSGPDREVRHSRRRQWAFMMWNRYGLPGLALAAPLVTGVHLATVIALMFRPDRKRLLFWMTLGLAVWTAGLVVVCYTGFEAIQSLLGESAVGTGWWRRFPGLR